MQIISEVQPKYFSIFQTPPVSTEGGQCGVVTSEEPRRPLAYWYSSYRVVRPSEVPVPLPSTAWSQSFEDESCPQRTQEATERSH